MRRNPLWRVARHSRAIFIHQATHHGGVAVEQFRFYREIVIVHNRVDTLAKRRETIDSDLPDALDIVLIADGKTLKIDKEMISPFVVAEPLFERDR